MTRRSMLAAGLMMALSLGALTQANQETAEAASKRARSPADISARQAKRRAKLARRAARAGYKAPTA